MRYVKLMFNFGAAKPCIKRVLHLVADLIESMSVDGVSRSKQICYQSVEEVIQTAMFLFPIYIRQPGKL